MLGITNQGGGSPQIDVKTDSNCLLYIYGDAYNDKSLIKSSCTFQTAGNVSLTSVTGPYGTTSPVIWLNTGAIGWLNTSWSRLPSTNAGWTVEFWRYKIANIGSEDCFCVGRYANTSDNCLHNDSSSNYYSYLWSNNGQISTSTAAPFNNGQWYHVAYVMKNNVLSLYLGGQLKQTYTNQKDPDLSQGIVFGANSWSGLSGDKLNSYIAEIRVSNIPRYESNFTVPSAPLYKI